MRSLLHRHLFIVLGVSLPLLLMLAVIGLQFAARHGVPPLATPVLHVHQPDDL